MVLVAHGGRSSWRPLDPHVEDELWLKHLLGAAIAAGTSASAPLTLIALLPPRLDAQFGHIGSRLPSRCRRWSGAARALGARQALPSRLRPHEVGERG